MKGELPLSASGEGDSGARALGEGVDVRPGLLAALVWRVTRARGLAGLSFPFKGLLLWAG